MKTKPQYVSHPDHCVCVVTPYFPVASETFIRGHIERLPAPTVLVHSWPPAVGNRPVLSLPTRVAYKVARRVSRNPFCNETTAAYIAAFRRLKARVVLAEYGPTAVAVMHACRKLDLPLVAHFHGYDASVREVLREHAETYPAMFKQAAAIIAVSRAMQRKLISMGAPADKVHYNPYGIDCDDFKGGRPEGGAAVFLAVGRFVPKKAPLTTLQAFAKVHAAVPNARLRMIGDGPLLEDSRGLAKQLRIDRAVTFLGAQPHAVVQDEMQRARAFVQHSVEAPDGDSEGTPLGIMEAGACGLPVVSTRHAGIPDVVIEGETGFLVDEGDVEGMAARMLLLARQPETAGQMGRSARLHIERTLSSQRSIGRLGKIIDSSVSDLRVRESTYRRLSPELDLS